MKKMLHLIGENRLDEVTDYLVSEIQKVAAIGADFALVASNTPHMQELVKDIFRDDTKKELLKIAGKLRDKEGIQGLILGGTELPLILKEADAEEIIFLDTTKIHIESIMQRLL